MDVAKIVDEMEKLLENHSLTPYEQNAISSMASYGKTKLKFSEKQIAFYESIAANYTEKAIQDRDEWLSSIDDKMIHDMKIIAAYYKAGGTYYLGLAEKILAGEKPTRKQYRNMCENRYAQSVLKEYYRAPKFEIGEVVYPKSNMPHRLAYMLRRGGLIMQANAGPIESHAKGSKKYLVLPVGEAYGELVEERWLKTRK